LILLYTLLYHIIIFDRTAWPTYISL